MAISAPRLGGQRWAVLGQALADACYAAFPIAYVSHGFRSALGLLWVPLWVYAAAWEIAWYLRDMIGVVEEDEATALESIEAPWKVVWGLCFVLPSLIAGGIVAFDALYPRQWPLDGEPPPFVCTPALLRPGDTLTLRMDTPHGGELGVFTPRGRFLSVVPTPPGDYVALVPLLSRWVGGTELKHLPKLRIVANCAVGYNNVDVVAAELRRVIVTNTPDVLTDATADLTWALILACARRLIEGVDLIRNGTWTGWHPEQLLGLELRGKTLGLLGAGRIGQAVGRRAPPFGMRVLCSAPSPKPEFAEETGAVRVELAPLLRESDVLSLHAPSTP